MAYNAEASVIKLLCVNINTPASHMLKHKFGTTLKVQQNIDVYNAFYRVCPPGNPETKFVPKEASYLVATMFYKYRNRHDVESCIKFEDALHRAYSLCTSETARRTFETLLSQIPGTSGFNHQIARVCALMTSTCDLSSIDYVALLYDVSHWHHDDSIARRWSRVMHQYNTPHEHAECEAFENNE